MKAVAKESVNGEWSINPLIMTIMKISVLILEH